MSLEEYLSAMNLNELSATTNPKEQLWQAVYNGAYNQFKKLIDEKNITTQDLTEYRHGITLLHCLVYSDRAPGYDTQATIDDKKKIARYLLEQGANLYAPATESAFGIEFGITPWQMADKYDHLPWYYHAGIRASFVYTGEHVMPVFKEHLGVKAMPSMLAQFSAECTKTARPILATLTATT